MNFIYGYKPEDLVQNCSRGLSLVALLAILYVEDPLAEQNSKIVCLAFDFL
uniref:Uncharacterized protein n=1 Tax=Arundo donax TaxID=35708 RepID=A0A0A9AB17_ARUDO